MEKNRSFTINEEVVGERLDQYLAKKLNVTRSHAQTIIKSSLLTVNGEVPKAKHELKIGDKITIATRVKNHPPKVEIVFEDEFLIIVNKPAGISVHASPADKDTVLTEVLKNKLQEDGSDRAGVVHRLDKGTSGVLVLAKDQVILEQLQKQFASRSVKKEYLALLHGNLLPAKGVIDMPISRDDKKKERMSISEEGKEAVTEFEVIRHFKNHSLVLLKPKTGRTHQLRVHLSALGYPIVGDKKYGRKNDGAKRIFLHAKSLTFRHPATGKIKTFQVELPEELAKEIESLN